MCAVPTRSARRLFRHFTGTPLYVRNGSWSTDTPLVFFEEARDLNLRIVTYENTKHLGPVTCTDNPLALNECLCEEEDIPIVLGRGVLSEPAARRAATRLADERGWHKKPRRWLRLRDIIDCGLQDRIRGVVLPKDCSTFEFSAAALQLQQDAIAAIPHLQLLDSTSRFKGTLINAELIDLPLELLQCSQWPNCQFVDINGHASHSVAAGQVLRLRREGDLEGDFVSSAFARSLGLRHTVDALPILGGYGSVQLCCTRDLPPDDAELLEFARRYRPQHVGGSLFHGSTQAALARAAWDSRLSSNPLTEIWVHSVTNDPPIITPKLIRWTLNSTASVELNGLYYWNVRAEESRNPLL